MFLSTISRQDTLSGKLWQSAQCLTIHRLTDRVRSHIENEEPMSKRNSPRGIPLSRSDQVTLVAVAIGILIVTGFLVSLLF